MKRIQLEPWTTWEKLCLANAVQRTGDQNWTAVGRAVKNIYDDTMVYLGNEARPSHWFSMKQCAAQYETLLNSVLGSRRKKRTDKSADPHEQPSHLIYNILKNEFLEELDRKIEEDKILYKKMKKKQEDILSGVYDDKLEDMIAEDSREKERDIKLKLKFKLGEKNAERNASPIKTYNPNTPEGEVVKTPGSNSSTSPLLTSLLQSPSQHSLPSTPTISLLLNSTPSTPTNESPTLSKLLESPSSKVPLSASSLGTPSIAMSPVTSASPAAVDTPAAAAAGSVMRSLVRPNTSSETPPRLSVSPQKRPVTVTSTESSIHSEIVIEEELLSQEKKQTKKRENEMEEEEVIESVEEILEKLKEAIIETVGGNDQDLEVITEQVAQGDEGIEHIQQVTTTTRAVCSTHDEADTSTPTSPLPVTTLSVRDQDRDRVRDQDHDRDQDRDRVRDDEDDEEEEEEEDDDDDDDDEETDAQSADQEPSVKQDTDDSQDKQETVDERKKEPSADDEKVFDDDEKIDADILAEAMSVVDRRMSDSEPQESVDTCLGLKSKGRQSDDSQANAETEHEDQVELGLLDQEAVEIIVMGSNTNSVINVLSQDSSSEDLTHLSTVENNSGKESQAESTEDDIKRKEKEEDKPSVADSSSVAGEESESSEDADDKERVEDKEEEKEEFSSKEDQVEDVSSKEDQASSRDEGGDSSSVPETLADPETTSDSVQQPSPPHITISARESLPEVKITLEPLNISVSQQQSSVSYKDEMKSTPVLEKFRRQSGRKRSSAHLDSKPTSPASMSFNDDEKEYRAWKKSVLLVFSRIASHKYASVFSKPITDTAGYKALIKCPMDLSTIKRNIETAAIKSTLEFQRDVMLMIQNAVVYNSHMSPVYSMALEMWSDVISEMDVMVQALGDGVLLGRPTTQGEAQATRSGRHTKQSLDNRKSNQTPPHTIPKRRRM